MGNILVIDDDADIRETVSDLLTEHGYSVFEAPDSSSALGHLRSQGIDFILMDYALPIPAEGEAFMRAKAADPRTAPIPLVLMSGYPVARMDGAFAVLRKPFGVDALLALVGKLTRPAGQTDDGKT
jgi:CheY-like chemotaxis protein